MNRYPYSLVWTPLPIITWFLPLIGHTGIADSQGVIYDFGGSRYIAVDNFTFGRPTKYLRLDPNKAEGATWDEAVQSASDKFRGRDHNIITNNCHDHVADALNQMKYDGKKDYTKFDIFLMMTFRSSFTGFGGFLMQWGPLLTLITILGLIKLFHSVSM